MPVTRTMTGQPPEQARAVLTQTIPPGGENGPDGMLFGGDALLLMGRAAQAVASRQTNGRVVMLATESVRFHQPVPVGHLLELTARLVHRKQATMTILVDGMMQSPAGGPRMLALSGYFQMLAIDEAGRLHPLGTA